MMAAFTMMDPDRINRSKDSSAEELTIEVLWVSAIESPDDFRHLRVRLSAVVRNVTRSKAGLRAGDVIDVMYEARKTTTVASRLDTGNSTERTLRQGESTVAFLKRSGATFVPDAIFCFSPRF